MGYRELLDALRVEVGRQAQQIRDDAGSAAATLRAEAERDAAARRESLLAETRRALDLARDEALEPVRREAEAARLRGQREALERLRASAEAALADLGSPAVFDALFEEILAETKGDAELRVAPALAPTLRERLAARGLEDRFTVESDPAIAGAGIVAICGQGRRRLDNTLHSRLQAVWSTLEGEIAARLFASGAPAETRATEEYAMDAREARL